MSASFSADPMPADCAHHRVLMHAGIVSCCPLSHAPLQKRRIAEMMSQLPAELDVMRMFSTALMGPKHGHSHHFSTDNILLRPTPAAPVVSRIESPPPRAATPVIIPPQEAVPPATVVTVPGSGGTPPSGVANIRGGRACRQAQRLPTRSMHVSGCAAQWRCVHHCTAAVTPQWLHCPCRRCERQH